MYLAHYGLTQAPFGITPNPAFFYNGGKRGEILEALVYAVTHGEGIVKVTGEVGSGKTMLCRMLENRLPGNVEVIYLINPTLGREEVLYAIAGELGLACGGRRADEVIRLLQEDLIRKHAAGRRTVLLIEEAQAMPLDTLEEIRLFSNLETAHSKLLQIVLFGQPELDENLRLPRMRQLKERITHSFAVPPLEPSAIHEYLMFRLRAAGYRGPDLFAADALRRIADVSSGIVRRISILADKALLAAFAEGKHGIELRHVEAAVRDSEFAPPARTTRWTLPGTVAPFANVLAGAGMTLALLALLGLVRWPSSTAPATAAVPVPSPAGHAVPAHPLQETPVVLTQLDPPVPPHAEPAQSGPEPAVVAVPTQSAAPVLNEDPPLRPVSAPASIEDRLRLTRSWLEIEDPARFTIQLALAGDAAQAERFVRRAELELVGAQLHVYPSRIGGMARFGVTVGNYASRQEALAEIKRISQAHGHRPQLRTIAGLRDEIARTASGGMWP